MDISVVNSNAFYSRVFMYGMDENASVSFDPGEVENMEQISDPYRESTPLSDISSIQDVRDSYSSEDDLDTDVWIVSGRVTRVNEFGDFVFYDIQDHSGEIQVMCSVDSRSEFETDNYELVDSITTGDHIVISGVADFSDTDELTINAETLSVSSKSLQTISTEWNELDDQSQILNRTSALISNTELAESVHQRFEMQNYIRSYLTERNYMEVETPILQGQAGGANATPFETFSEDLNRDFYLRIAPELYLKRLIVAGYNSVYEMARCFRNESIDTSHNPEFTMLELYQQYSDYTDMMDLFESLTEEVAESVVGDSVVEYDGRELDLSNWERVSFDDLIIDEFEEDSLDNISRENILEYLSERDDSLIDESENYSYDELLMEVFEEIEESLEEPTIVYNFPRISTPLCQTVPENPSRVERFEAFVMGTEIANAYSELTNPIEQMQRLENQVGEENIDQINTNFVEAISYGMPPTGGMGIGIERLAMILTDSQSIKQVIPYPMTGERV